MRKVVLMAFISLFMFATLTLQVKPFVAAEPDIIRVPEDYPTIQAAINAASPGDTIKVASGTYYEHIIVNKSNLKLMGEDPHNTIIDGNWTDNVVTVTVDNVSVSGFTIKNADSLAHSGIYLYNCSGSVISGNTIIFNHWDGISLYYTNNTTIIGNIISYSIAGIGLHNSHNNTIADNRITSNVRGIFLGYSSSNTITGNTIAYNNSSFSSAGIFIAHAEGNTIYHNNFIDNWVAGEFGSTYDGNIWDNGAGEGNFWDDYTGEDLNGDGVGDTNLPHHGVDYYPLMNPYDAIPPTTTHNYDGQWHTTDFTINLTATDDFSGVQTTYYKINDGPTKTVSADGQPLITTEGTQNKLEYWSVDKANNTELHKTLTNIKLDKTSPYASAGPNQTVEVGTVVTFNANSSSDNIGIVSYEWNFGDGTNGTGLTTTHTYTEPGTYTVTIRVRDATGNEDTDSMTVTVKETTTSPLWIIGVGGVTLVVASTLMLALRRRRRGKV